MGEWNKGSLFDLCWLGKYAPSLFIKRDALKKLSCEEGVGVAFSANLNGQVLRTVNWGRHVNYLILLYKDLARGRFQALERTV